MLLVLVCLRLELRDCIIHPLRKLFNSTFSPMERLLLLLYLHKLLLHWIGAEYDRVTRLRAGSGSQGVFGRADSTGSGVDAGRSADDDANKAPLSAVAGLMDAWSDLARLGLVKTFSGANGGRRSGSFLKPC